MKRRLPLSLGVATALATALVSAPAAAASTSLSGALSATDPSYSRVFNCSVLSVAGTDVFFDLFRLTATATGVFDIGIQSGRDSFLTLYQGPFNPADARQNCLASDDDGGPGVDAMLHNITLQAGTEYHAVVTSLTNGQTFGYSLTATRDEADTGGAVPVLESIGRTPSAVVTGALTSSDARYNRPFTCSTLSIVGTDVFYDAYQVSVSSSGRYDLNVRSGIDSFLTLYRGTFDAANALSGCMLTDDDGGVGVDAGIINAPLEAGVPYVAVVTALTNGRTSPYTLTVGPNRTNFPGGQATVSVVPEPASVLLWATGLAGLLGWRARRSQRAAPSVIVQ